MLVTIGRLRRIIREAIEEEDDLIEQALDEVDTDPSNNPGRPADAAEYIGMKPDPKWAMSHPGQAGASELTGGGSTGGGGGEAPEGDVGF